jgi:hypothetical protein
VIEEPVMKEEKDDVVCECGFTRAQALEELNRIYEMDPDSDYDIFDVYYDHDMGCSYLADEELQDLV